MPFALKNTGVTYQKLMDKIFHNLLGKVMEVYVDDIVIKFVEAEHQATDLNTVFVGVR